MELFRAHDEEMRALRDERHRLRELLRASLIPLRPSARVRRAQHRWLDLYTPLLARYYRETQAYQQREENAS